VYTSYILNDGVPPPSPDCEVIDFLASLSLSLIFRPFLRGCLLFFSEQTSVSFSEVFYDPPSTFILLFASPSPLFLITERRRKVTPSQSYDGSFLLEPVRLTDFQIPRQSASSPTNQPFPTSGRAPLGKPLLSPPCCPIGGLPWLFCLQSNLGQAGLLTLP